MLSFVNRFFKKKYSSEDLKYFELRDINISWWPTLDLNYWGITKCGNTKIRSHLHTLSTGGEYQISSDFERENLVFLTREKAFANGARNFTVTRHPLLRFVSVWKDLCRTRPKRGVKAGLDPSWSLLQLANWVKDMPDEVVDVHFKSQNWFIPKKLDVEIDLNNLDRDWPFEIAAPTRVRVRPSNEVGHEIDDETRRVVLQRYAGDFDRFGYSEDPFD